jgi:uncharacterized protein (TIGR00255 family)
MVKSMTGFGRSEENFDNRCYVVEIKSVNHRFGEVYVKLPKEYSLLEENVRKLVLKKVSRGRIDVYITIENFGENDKIVEVNTPLMTSYLKAIQEIAQNLKLDLNIDLIQFAKLPDMLVIKDIADAELVWSELETVVQKAIEQLIAMRDTEGKKLANDIKIRGERIGETLKKIEERSPEVVEEYRNRLQEKIRQILPDIQIDENRLITEVAIFAERSSINEEIVRLESHLEQLMQILTQEGPIGRKLDFLLQEMNREINTIGSKANDLAISKMVVEIKSELEKIREQIQNIE